MYQIVMWLQLINC